MKNEHKTTDMKHISGYTDFPPSPLVRRVQLEDGELWSTGLMDHIVLCPSGQTA